MVVCELCSSSLVHLHTFQSPPKGEVHFKLCGEYKRSLLFCPYCGHFMNDFSGVELVPGYGDTRSVKKRFAEILSLPYACSDNFARMVRVEKMVGKGGKVLDVGGGLGVFAFELKRQGYRDVTAIEPVEELADHLIRVVGVKTIWGRWEEFKGAGGPFDLITFIQVLEHVDKPVEFLARAKSFLSSAGQVYVEVPDGEEAIVLGPAREEFMLDHRRAFSFLSFATLVKLTGKLKLEWAERLTYPSGKKIIRGGLRCL